MNGWRVRAGATKQMKSNGCQRPGKAKTNDSLLKIAFDVSAVFRPITIYHAICGSITIFIDFKCKQMV